MPVAPGPQPAGIADLVLLPQDPPHLRQHPLVPGPRPEPVGRRAGPEHPHRLAQPVAQDRRAAPAAIHRAICNRNDSRNGRPMAPSATPATAPTASGTSTTGVTTAGAPPGGGRDQGLVPDDQGER